MLLVIFLIVSLIQGKEVRFRDETNSPSTSCDANEFTYRGTDNRWMNNPEIPYSLETENPDLWDYGAKISTGGILPSGRLGFNYGIPGGLMTHCPDARMIRCDPETNLFHAPNYLSIPYDDDTYGKYMTSLFNYTKPLSEINCSEFTLVGAYDPLKPSSPPSGFSPTEEPTSRQKLMFHSMQVIGRVTEPDDYPDDDSETPCTNFWGDGIHGSDPTRQARRANPPFFCVYTPTIMNTYPASSNPACSGFSEASSINFQHSSQSNNENAQNPGYIVNPNCGAVSALNTSFSSQPVVDFFQVWLAPVTWENRYNWESLFTRTPGESSLGYSSVISQITDRFVDCDAAVSGRNPLLSNLCLPYKKRTARHPLLTGGNIDTACNVIRQLECAPPISASGVTEGTECFCSFPYTNSISEVNRDPWDVFCFSGDLSSLSIDNRDPGNAHGRVSLYGNDYVVTPAMTQEMESIKIQTDNQWTFYDWTPVFTYPPYSMICPPVEYLFVDQEEDIEGNREWVIRTIHRSDFYKDHEWDVSPFFDPLSGWGSKWPTDLPLPTGLLVKPEEKEFNMLTPTAKQHKEQKRNISSFRDYMFIAQFKDMRLTTESNKKNAANLLEDLRTVSPDTSGDIDQCQLSESARHYSSNQATIGFWNRGVSLNCSYDLTMYYEKRVLRSTTDGDMIFATPMRFDTELILEYHPSIAPSSFHANIYYPVNGEDTEWNESAERSSKDESNPESSTRATYICSPPNHSPNDCVVRTTQNILGEASLSAHKQYLNDNGGSPLRRHFNFNPFFTDGICATSGLFTNNQSVDSQVIGGLDICYRPSEMNVDTWYQSRLSVEDKDTVWRHQFIPSSQSIITEDNRIVLVDPEPEIVTRSLKMKRQEIPVTNDTEFTIISPVDPRPGMLCPPAQLITCDSEKGWYVLGDSEERWRFSPVNSTGTGVNESKTSICFKPRNRYVVYAGTRMREIGLIYPPETRKLASINKGNSSTVYATEAGNAECIYKLMRHDHLPNGALDGDSYSPAFRTYTYLSFVSTGFVVDTNKFMSVVLTNGSSILLSEFRQRRDTLEITRHDFLDVCIYEEAATFSNYSDPTPLRCSCTATPLHGSGCVCGGTVYLTNSPLYPSSDMKFDGSFSYISHSIPVDGWNMKNESACVPYPDPEDPDSITTEEKEVLDSISHVIGVTGKPSSWRNLMDSRATLGPMSDRFMCPTPNLLRCTSDGFYSIDGGLRFNYVPGTLRANYYLKGGIVIPETANQSVGEVGGEEGFMRLVPDIESHIACWAPNTAGGKVPAAYPTGGISYGQETLHFTIESEPQIQVTFAPGSDKQRIVDIRCNYVLVAPQCQGFLNSKRQNDFSNELRIWDEAPMVSFSMTLEKPSLVWLDRISMQSVLNFDSKCQKHELSDQNNVGPFYPGDTYVCPGASSWCGEDIGLRIIDSLDYNIPTLNKYRFCCDVSWYEGTYFSIYEITGLPSSICLRSPGDAFVPWWYGIDNSRGVPLYSDIYDFYTFDTGGSAGDFFACDYAFSEEIASVLPWSSHIRPLPNSLGVLTSIIPQTPQPTNVLLPGAGNYEISMPFQLRPTRDVRSFEDIPDHQHFPTSPSLTEGDDLLTCSAEALSGVRRGAMEIISSHGEAFTAGYVSETIDALKRKTETTSIRNPVLPRVTGCPDPRRDFACEDNTLKFSSFSYRLLDVAEDPCLFPTSCLGQLVTSGVVDPFRSSEVQWGLTNVAIHFVTEAAYFAQNVPPANSANVTATGETMWEWLNTASSALGEFSQYSVVCEYSSYRNPLIKTQFANSTIGTECPVDRLIVVGPPSYPQVQEDFVEFHNKVNQFDFQSYSPLDYFESPFVPVKLLSLKDQRTLVNLAPQLAFSLDYDPLSNDTEVNGGDEIGYVHIPLPGWEYESDIYLHRHLFADLPPNMFNHSEEEAVYRSFPFYRGECTTAFGRYINFRRDANETYTADDFTFNDDTSFVILPSPCSSFSHASFVCDCPFYDIRATEPLFSSVATSCHAELTTNTLRATDAFSSTGRSNDKKSYLQERVKKNDLLPRERTTCPIVEEIGVVTLTSGNYRRSVFTPVPGFSRCSVYDAKNPPQFNSVVYSTDCSSPFLNTSTGNGTNGKVLGELQFAQASIFEGSTLYCTYAFQNIDPSGLPFDTQEDWYLVRYRSDHPYAILPSHYHGALIYPTPGSLNRTYTGGWTSGSVCDPDFTVRNPSANKEIYDYHRQWFPCTSVCGDPAVGDYISPGGDLRVSRAKSNANNGQPLWQETVSACSCPVARMDESAVYERDDFFVCKNNYAPGTLRSKKTVGEPTNQDTNTAREFDPQGYSTQSSESLFPVLKTQEKRPMAHTCPPAEYIDSKILATLPSITANVLNGPSISKTTYRNTPSGGEGNREAIYSDQRKEAFRLEEILFVERVYSKNSDGATNYHYKRWNKPKNRPEQVNNPSVVAAFDALSLSNMTKFFKLHMCGDVPIDNVFSSSSFTDRGISTLCKKEGTFTGAQVTLTGGIASIETALSGRRRRSNGGNIISQSSSPVKRDVSIPSGGTLFCSYAYNLSITPSGIQEERQSVRSGGSFSYPREAIVVFKSVPGDHYTSPARIWKTAAGDWGNSNSANPPGNYYGFFADNSINNTGIVNDYWRMYHYKLMTTGSKRFPLSVPTTAGTSHWLAECGINLCNTDSTLSNNVSQNFCFNNPCSCRMHLTNGDNNLQYEWDYRSDVSCQVFGSSVPTSSSTSMITSEYQSCQTSDTGSLLDRARTGYVITDGGVGEYIDYPSLSIRTIDGADTDLVFPESEGGVVIAKPAGYFDESPNLSLSQLFKTILYYENDVDSINGKRFFNSKAAEWIQSIYDGGFADSRTDASTTCPPPECLNALLSNSFSDRINDFGYVCLEQDPNVFLHDIHNADPLAEFPEFFRMLVGHESEANSLTGLVYGTECGKNDRPTGVLEDLLLSDSYSKGRNAAKDFDGESIIFRGARVLVPNDNSVMFGLNDYLNPKTGGETCPVVTCEYFDSLRNKIVQLQSFVTTTSDPQGAVFQRSSLGSFLPRLYPRQTFWGIGEAERLVSPTSTELFSYFRCGSNSPSRSVCHCPLIRLSSGVSPWDSCAACGKANSFYGELDLYASSSTFDLFTPSTCSLSTTTIESSSISFVGLCGFLHPTQSSASGLGGNGFIIQKSKPRHYHSGSGENIWEENPNNEGIYQLKEEFSGQQQIPPIEVVSSDQFELSIIGGKHSSPPVCPAVTTSEFFSYTIPSTPLHDYFLILGNEGLSSVAIEEDKIGFPRYNCPLPETIGYDHEKGFHVKGDTSNLWLMTHLEHEIAESIYFATSPPSYLPFPPDYVQSNLYNSLTSLIGAADVDVSSIRFIAAYESPQYQCKYLFHSLVSTPILVTGSAIPYHSLPHFFYLSPRVNGISGLIHHACRGYIRNGTGDVSTESTVNHDCHLILRENDFPSLANFVSQVPTLLLCNYTDESTRVPKTIYEIANDFAALGGSSLPTASVVEANYEGIIETLSLHHPYHTSSKSIKTCRNLNPRNCPLLSPIAPFTQREFVSYAKMTNNNLT